MDRAERGRRRQERKQRKLNADIDESEVFGVVQELLTSMFPGYQLAVIAVDPNNIEDHFMATTIRFARIREALDVRDRLDRESGRPPR